MRLLLHDTLATAPFAVPLAAGWLTPPDGLETASRPELTAADVGPEDTALVPTPEASALQGTHRVLPDAAVVAGPVGSVAMRVPVRPDGIERTPVRLSGEASGAAEILARATLRAFYGIEPIGWTREDDAEAQVMIVEGAEALRTPEAGYAEDLCRAWFILTGTPAVTHVLVAPLAADRAALGATLDLLAALRAQAHTRRRDLRRELVATHGLDDPDRLAELLNGQRYALEPADRRALADLLARGTRGSIYPTPRPLAFLDAAG